MDDSTRTITSNIVDYAGSIGANVVRDTNEGVAQIPDSKAIPHQITAEPPSKVLEIAHSPEECVEKKPLETRKVDKILNSRGIFKTEIENLQVKLGTFKERGLGTFIDDALERLQEVSEGLNTDDPTRLTGPMTKAVTILEELLDKNKTVGAKLTVVKEVRSELKKLVSGFRDKFALIVTKVAKKIHKIADKMASGLDFVKKVVNSVQQGVETFHTILKRDVTVEEEGDKTGDESLETTVPYAAVEDSSQQSVEASPAVPEKEDTIAEGNKTGDESQETTVPYAAVRDSSQQSVEASPAVPEKEDTIAEGDKTGDESPETTVTYAAVGDDDTGENS
ncbi:MAG: hypothetical protein LBF94_00405 [Puniceicoccales bacterium]|jgi:hypothetical protein|nr:hypothetical protein [Puniceicoccales bacterium]